MGAEIPQGRGVRILARPIAKNSVARSAVAACNACWYGGQLRAPRHLVTQRAREGDFFFAKREVEIF
jgi:hypothetical protein